MKIVLDTNVLVAGLLSPFGPCAQIMRMVSSGELTLCLDARLLSEYNEVLCRPKFQFRIDKVTALLDYVEHNGLIVASSPWCDPLPDPSDSLSSRSPWQVKQPASSPAIVHFPAKRCPGVNVLSSSEFLTFHRKQQRNR